MQFTLESLITPSPRLTWFPNFQSGEAKGGHSRAPLLEPIIDEDKEDEELEDKVVEAGLSPADALTVPTRNESVSQFSTAPEGYRVPCSKARE